MAAAVPSPTPLDAHDEGTGPVVLLLHGVGGDRTVWNGIAPTLAKSFRVIAPDLRGHGRTPAPPGSLFTFEELLADVLALLDGKHVRAAHWVGLSGGAFLALRAALDRPERVRSLTMISGAAYTDSHTRSITDRFIETYAKEGPDAYALRLLKDLYYPDWIEAHLDLADRVRDGIAQRDLRPATAWTRAADRFDERSRIATLTVPVLIVQGMDDAVIDPAHGRILRQSIPRAQIRILPQTGHMVPLERPSETADAIEGFVRSVEAPTVA
ncbi:MAG TPA: alpha/beta fold hydrolase [Thermoplasmata archaeon]|nr:alpha/beta fold hydrolase [Thermoplasmata archaeon]